MRDRDKQRSPDEPTLERASEPTVGHRSGQASGQASEQPDRRRILTLGGIGGAFALLPTALPMIGCGGDDAAKREAEAKKKKKSDEENDVKLLNEGILLEQGAVLVYKAAAGLPFIASDKTVLGVAGLFMSQHEEHRDSLAKWVTSLGGSPADAATAKAPDIPKAILDASLDDATRKIAVLKFARSLELAAANAYFQLIVQQLQTEFARRQAAEILPVEAQHVAIYDLVLGAEKPVGAALFSEQS